MYRTVFYIGLFGTALSVLGMLLTHSNSPMVFLVPTGGVAIMVSILGVALMHFGVFSRLRNLRAKRLFGVLGVVMVAIGAIGLIDPLYFGMLKVYAPISDQVGFLMSGIGLLAAWLETPRQSLDNQLADYLRQRYAERLTKVRKLRVS